MKHSVPQTPTLIILEPGFIGLKGHEARYFETICHVAESNGRRVVCAVGPNAPTEVLDWLSTKKVDVWRGSATSRFVYLPVRVLNWLAGSAGLASDLRSLAHSFDAPECIFVPSGLPERVLGAILGALLVGPETRVVLQLMGWDRKRKKGIAHWPVEWLYAGTEKLLSRVTLKNLTILADHQGIVNTLRARTGREYALAPMPFDWTSYPLQQPGDSDPVFAFVGQAREEKGFYQMVDAVELLDDSYRFLIQVSSYEKSERLDDAVRRLERRSNVRLIRESPSMKEYPNLFREFDVSCLPYDPAEYANRSSAILLESAGCAKYVIVPEATALSAGIGKWVAGIQYSPWSAQELAKAIRTVRDDWASRRSACWEFAAMARSQHSALALAKVVLESSLTGENDDLNPSARELSENVPRAAAPR